MRQGSKFGASSRVASGCQFTCTTNPGKCHLPMTTLPTYPISHIQDVTVGQCRFLSWEGRV